MRRRSALVTVASLLALGGCTSIVDSDRDGRVDASGEITVVVDGSRVDLSADRFQAEHAEDDALAFHLHEGDDDWYMEGTERVTLAEAIDLLPHFAYTHADGSHVVTIDGTDYDEREPGTELAFLVDAESVDPRAHTLEDGDAIRIEIATDGA